MIHWIPESAPTKTINCRLQLDLQRRIGVLEDFVIFCGEIIPRAQILRPALAVVLALSLPARRRRPRGQAQVDSVRNLRRLLRAEARALQSLDERGRQCGVYVLEPVNAHNHRRHDRAAHAKHLGLWKRAAAEVKLREVIVGAGNLVDDCLSGRHRCAKAFPRNTIHVMQ